VVFHSRKKSVFRVSDNLTFGKYWEVEAASLTKAWCNFVKKVKSSRQTDVTLSTKNRIVTRRKP
jgi:hypothetical protein